MYTLDGRIRFRLSISADDEARFRNEKLREIVLSGQAGVFRLSFTFALDTTDAATPLTALPEYVVLLDSSEPLTETALGDAV